MVLAGNTHRLTVTAIPPHLQAALAMDSKNLGEKTASVLNMHKRFSLFPKPHSIAAIYILCM
jgi:hypothetical protein